MTEQDKGGQVGGADGAQSGKTHTVLEPSLPARVWLHGIIPA